MKIFYLANIRIPTEKAHGHQIMKMCQMFAVEGAEVALVVPTRKNKINQDPFDFYRLKRTFRIVRVKIPDVIDRIKFFGRLAFPLQTLFFLLALLFFEADKTAVIYSRQPELIWLFKKKGYRTVYECHDWFGRKKKLALFFLRHSDYLVTTNQHIKAKLAENGFLADRILVAPNGIDLKTFDIGLDKTQALAALKLSLANNSKLISRPVLFYSGSFRTMGVDKGLDQIVEAMALVESKTAIFWAVGGSPTDLQHYRRLAEERGVAEKCLFLPPVSQQQLAVCQQASDVFLMPFPDKAHYRYFMTPLKMFEYLAGAKPIIASDLPSIREILDEKSAYFCQPGSAKDLAAKIDQVLGSYEQAAARAKNNIALAQKYTWEKRAKNILNFIKL